MEYTESSGNVFADLGLENSEELLAKSRLALEILRIIKKRKLTQAKAAKILDTDQSQISILKTGDCLQRFTFDRLLTWLTKLDCDVTLTVRPKPRNQECGLLEVSV
ncbi:MAG TPA: XRE family transcriptional regulator [Nitrospirae bacterium]|nr:XRE family transcriptional regulator [Nitrospirota bacterium]